MYSVLRHLFALLMYLVALSPSMLFAYPSVYPTGTTIYKPDKVAARQCKSGLLTP